MAALGDRGGDDMRKEGLASDANTMVDKTDIDGENTDFEAEKTDVEGDNSSGNAGEVLPEDTLSPSDYPTGLQFFFILFALILSIFMVALDLVCFVAPISTFPFFFSFFLIKRDADSKPDRLSWRQPFQKSRTSFAAFPTLDGTARHSSSLWLRSRRPGASSSSISP